MYPTLDVGNDVSFAASPDSPRTQWRLGRVVLCKNDSCDIEVFTPNGSEYRHDCIHIDDPRCYTSRDHLETGRGVFQLAQCEIDRRRILDGLTRLSSLEATVRALERAHEREIMKTKRQLQESGVGT